MSDDEDCSVESCANIRCHHDISQERFVGHNYDGPTQWCPLPATGKARPLAEGEGRLTLLDGSVYVGSFMLGERHGRGKYSSCKADDQYEYEGEWRNDQPFGVGKMTFKTGRWCEGQWSAGVMHGRGTSVTDAGEKYVGEFVDDLRHGTGKLYDASGALIRAGEWKKDEEYDPPPKAAAKNYAFTDRVRLHTPRALARSRMLIHCAFTPLCRSRRMATST